MLILYLKIQYDISQIWCYQIYLVIPTTCQFPDVKGHGTNARVGTQNNASSFKPILKEGAYVFKIRWNAFISIVFPM